MSSTEYLREFVNERLTAAAEEIFRVFKQTIFEYEEEIDRQRRLRDIIWKPEIKLHRIELPQQHVSREEEEVLADQQLWNQERNSSLEQDDPEPSQIKKEQEEFCSSQEGEQLVLKQETDTFMLTPTYEDREHNEDQTVCLNPDKKLSEANSDLQLLFNNCHLAESQNQKGGKHEDTGSTRNAEPQQNNQQHKKKSDTKNVNNPAMLKAHCNTDTAKKSFKCDTCGKHYLSRTNLQTHMKTHTGERPFACKTCGKKFLWKYQLTSHMRIHTGERPFLCKTCGKRFLWKYQLTSHMRIHTGEKPYVCKECGKDFTQKCHLSPHMRTHTGEKPYTCTTCGRAFSQRENMLVHMRRVHTDEKPCVCKTCGKRFSDKGSLSMHVKIHTDEKSFVCKTCGKAFRRSNQLKVHMVNLHTVTS